MDMRTYNPAKACKAQDEFCDREHDPHFAPHSGICFHCHQNIYAEGGISVEEAGRELVTGCPFCNYSFCD